MPIGNIREQVPALPWSHKVRLYCSVCGTFISWGDCEDSDDGAADLTPWEQKGLGLVCQRGPHA